MFRRRSLLILLTATAGLVLSACACASEPLVLGIQPYLSASELHQRFHPLAHYLEERLGRPIRLDVSPDYETHVERIARGELDFAYLGPPPYVYLVERAGPKRLLARLEVRGKPLFSGYIVTREDSPLRTLADLTGHSLAFCDPDSAMGHLLPRAMLTQAGVPLERLSRYEYLSNHENVALGVLVGAFDAGAVKEETYEAYQSKGLRALAKSPEISPHLFVAADHLGEETVDALRRALLSVDSPHILAAIKKGVTGLVSVTDADYDSLRQLLKSTPSLRREAGYGSD